VECIVTYQKSNGEIFIRPYKFTSKKIGEETSMGWKVLNIHYKYGNNYYIEYDYRKILRKAKEPLKSRIIRKFIKQLNKLV